MADAAIAERRFSLVPAWCGRLLAAVAERLAAERNRHLLWLPVSFGAGIGVYFALTVEPPLWPGLVMASAGAVVSLAMRRHPAWCRTALALAVFAAGFALMRETAWERQTPMLQRQLGPVTVTGRVVDVDLAERGWRRSCRAGVISSASSTSPKSAGSVMPSAAHVVSSAARANSRLPAVAGR